MPDGFDEIQEETMEDDTSVPSDLTYFLDFKRGAVRKKIDDIEALRQAIIMILSTERGAWSIYDENYGCDLYKLVGMPRNYIIARLPDMIESALLQDDRITEITDYEYYVPESEPDTLVCVYTVNSVFGDIEMQTEVG
jgi:hypothetical protein